LWVTCAGPNVPLASRYNVGLPEDDKMFNSRYLLPVTYFSSVEAMPENM